MSVPQAPASMSIPASIPASAPTSTPAPADVLRAGRGDLDTLVALGLERLEAGDARTAAAFARAAHFVDDARIAPVRLLGQALAALGEHREAVDLLRGVLDTPRAANEPALAQGPLDEVGTRIALAWALCALTRANEAIVEFERAVRLAPRSSAALAGLGDALAQAKRYPEALDTLNRAIGLDVQYGPAYTALGRTLTEVGRAQAALKPLERALALDTGRGAPAVALGQALVRLGRLGEALPWFNRAIAIEPACAEAFRHLGRTLAALRFDKEALDCIRAARTLRHGDWPDTWMDEAGLHLRRGDFRAGWRAYEKREFAQRLANAVPPMWNGDDAIEGESLLLIAEQGLGDTLQFIRFAPRVAALGAKVTVEVQPPLRDLLRRCFAQTQVDVIARDDPRPDYTRQNSLVGMPYALQEDPATYARDVPYLFADADRLPHWRAELDAHAARAGLAAPRMRVGLVASGNPQFKLDADRSMPLAEMAPLFARTDIQWVVVQPELRERDRTALDAHPAVWWTGDALRDFDDTAALLASLDLVISVDTGVAHLSGAMGRPVWILLPYFGDWRWQHDRDDSPWYPSARLFRQPQPKDWASVVAALGAALADFPI
ncbi:tetratricopeptide repeat protein [Pararobbsia silviterrae]|uniref:tetratricopeptide repeat-containing glycosyltransferase family protein n=1 Tax=Pararobbsia silviterrae TaxID=1792498 RepID=UPI0011C3C5D1|nr:tetratricopeptide repeat-containing glycosyltransferase family protein [Pararobbsia silviterrae]